MSSCLPYFHTWCGLSSHLECRSEMCCTRLAENTRCIKSPSGYHRTNLSGYIFATMARIDNRKKNLLSSSISSTCPHSMVNFSPLPTEIISLAWGTSANLNGFAPWQRYCIVVGVSQTFTALIRGRHLYSAGRPSRWTLAHISSSFFLSFFLFSSPNLSGRRLDVYHTSTHGVALVRI